MQEGNATISEDDHGEDEGNPFGEGEHGRHEAEPHLDHLAVHEHWDAQQQAPPKSDAEHLLVSAVVGAVPGMRGMVHVGGHVVPGVGGMVHGGGHVVPHVLGMIHFVMCRVVHTFMHGVVHHGFLIVIGVVVHIVVHGGVHGYL